MVHVLRSEDLQAVELSLRKMLEAWTASPILLTQTSFAWDDFRRVFGEGKAPKGVSVDGAAMADAAGLMVLIEDSGEVPDAVRRSLLSVVSIIKRGDATGARFILRDSHNGKKPTQKEIKLHKEECRARGWDDRPISELVNAIESAIQIVESTTKATGKPGRPPKKKQVVKFANEELRKGTPKKEVHLAVNAELNTDIGSYKTIARYFRELGIKPAV